MTWQQSIYQPAGLPSFSPARPGLDFHRGLLDPAPSSSLSLHFASGRAAPSLPSSFPLSPFQRRPLLFGPLGQTDGRSKSARFRTSESSAHSELMQSVNIQPGDRTNESGVRVCRVRRLKKNFSPPHPSSYVPCVERTAHSLKYIGLVRTMSAV